MFTLNFNNNTDNPTLGTLVIYHSDYPEFKHYVDRINITDVKQVDEEVAKAKATLAELVGKKDANQSLLDEIANKLNT